MSAGDASFDKALAPVRSQTSRPNSQVERSAVGAKSGLSRSVRRRHTGGPRATVDRREGFGQRPEPRTRRRRRGRIRGHRAGGPAPAGHASGTPLGLLSRLAFGGDRRQSDQREQPTAVAPPPEQGSQPPFPGGFRQGADVLAGRTGHARSPGGGHRSGAGVGVDRKSTRLNSSHLVISYAVF